MHRRQGPGVTVIANAEATVQPTTRGRKDLHPFEDKNQDVEDSGCSSSLQLFHCVTSDKPPTPVDTLLTSQIWIKSPAPPRRSAVLRPKWSLIQKCFENPMTFGNTRQFYSKTPEFWPVTEVFTWQQLISPSFTCAFGVCVHISLCKLSVALPLELAGERFTQCCCKFAGLCHSFEGWRTGGSFVRETQSDGPMDSHQSAPIPTESWGHFTDDWWKCPSCVYSASQWWLYQMLFFFFRQCCGVCCVLVEGLKIPLSCWIAKNMLFHIPRVHFIRMYWVGIMLGPRIRQCCREDRCRGKITLHSDTVSGWGKAGIPPPDLRALSWQRQRICDPEGTAARQWRFRQLGLWENKFPPPFYASSGGHSAGWR